MLDKFHKACQNVVDNMDKKALNYAVNYARYGLSISDVAEAKVQALYILNNIQYWRGGVSKETRQMLKDFSKS